MSHEESIELLPWLVNGSLSASERGAVEAHAESCIVCRRELAELGALQESIQVPAFVVPAPDMRRINARIDAQLEREAWGHNVIAALREFFASPWRAAFAAQSLALVAVAALWLQADTDEPQFRTLTSTEALPADNHLRVVFDPTVEAEAIDALLADVGLGVASGPTERGVLTLRFVDATTAADRAAVSETLRDDPRVLFVQPVAGGN
jgi:anti-sigma factor RsiW